MDIVIIDLIRQKRYQSKLNVAFETQLGTKNSEIFAEEQDEDRPIITNKLLKTLESTAEDCNVPIPSILFGSKNTDNLNKLFQYPDGKKVNLIENYHSFSYLSFAEKFELNQYQNLLDDSMRSLFQLNLYPCEAERKKLMYYDKTTMENHLCSALFFSTSREIMRITVKLVCGSPADKVSLLFYLHQCYRTLSSRNQLDGDNMRLREKLLGYCRKRLACKLQQGVADITLQARSILEIKTYSDKQVILETNKGEKDYVCNLLAMALKPDELKNIRVDTKLVPESEIQIVRAMTPGRCKKFQILYQENFWRQAGYSGDILSIRGPIIWAMERPNLSTTGSLDRFPGLIGYLKIHGRGDCESEVVEQLVKLFGDEAGDPVDYSETELTDIFVPRCGDFVALRQMTEEEDKRLLEWSALDIFAEGDVAAAINAGHVAYLQLLRYLRPQAQSFDDVNAVEVFTVLQEESPVGMWLNQINYVDSVWLAAYGVCALVGLKLMRDYWKGT